MPSESLAARCEDVVKTYASATGEVRALRGVSARFPEGVVSAVVGPSGSGKSSLLRLLCGIDLPTSGSIQVGDTPLHQASPRALRALRRRRIGYMFQRPSDNFLPYLTVAEHLARSARGAPPQAPAPTAVIRQLGITHRLDHLPGELSGGEQQRAAIAQVLVSGARIVVADEPTAELDEFSDRSLLEVIASLRGVSFILATHDPTVWRHASEVIELEHGRLRGPARAPTAKPDPTHPPPGPDPPPRPTLFEIRGISKSYRRGHEVVHAVREATLAIRQSEVLALVGRSGSGKTTLLNVVGGWEQPDRGGIAWRVPPATYPPSWGEVAMMPQRLGLLEEISVRANIEYPARLSGRLQETADLVDRLLDDLGLVAVADRLPRETSVGEQQRTALARALVLSPRLLLADEPTGHQDKGWGDAIFAALRSAAASGTTCVVATHDRDVIRQCDRVVAMADGRLADAR